MTAPKSFEEVSRSLSRAKEDRKRQTAAASTALAAAFEKEFSQHPELVEQTGEGPSYLREVSTGILSEEALMDLRPLENQTPIPVLPLPELPVPKLPAMQSLQPQFLTAPGPGQQPLLPGQPGQNNPSFQRQIRPPQDRPVDDMPKPPVPLTDEQQLICAWIYLRRQVKAEKYAERREKLFLVEKVVSIGVGLLSIVGGILAIRNGLKSAARDY